MSRAQGSSHSTEQRSRSRTSDSRTGHARAIGASILVLGMVAPACGSKSTESSTGSAAASTSSAKPSASAVSKPSYPAPLGMCDFTVLGEHNCFEYFDADTLRDGDALCGKVDGTSKKSEYCPMEGRVGGCRLPGGATRYSYAKSVEDAAKHCKDSEGAFAAGNVAPPADPMIAGVCTEPDGSECTLEKIYVKDRAPRAKKDCEALERKWSEGGSCPTKDAVGTCVVNGVKWETSYAPKENAKKAEAECAESNGFFTPAKP